VEGVGEEEFDGRNRRKNMFESVTFPDFAYYNSREN